MFHELKCLGKQIFKATALGPRNEILHRVVPLTTCHIQNYVVRIFKDFKRKCSKLKQAVDISRIRQFHGSAIDAMSNT